jgi:hypothetical protein
VTSNPLDGEAPRLDRLDLGAGYFSSRGSGRYASDRVEALQEFVDDFPYLGTFAVLLLESLGGGPNI